MQTKRHWTVELMDELADKDGPYRSIPTDMHEWDDDTGVYLLQWEDQLFI